MFLIVPFFSFSFFVCDGRIDRGLGVAVCFVGVAGGILLVRGLGVGLWVIFWFFASSFLMFVGCLPRSCCGPWSGLLYECVRRAADSSL